MIDTHFELVNEGAVNEFFWEKMVFYISSFRFSVTTFMVTLFRFITNTFFRYRIDVSSDQKECFKADDVVPNEGNEIEVLDYEDSDYDTFGEKETPPKFSFKFQFKSYDDHSISSSGDTRASISNKREFIPKKVLSGFIGEPNVMNFTVKEMFLNANEVSFDSKEILDDGFLSEKDFMKHNSERVEVVNEEIINNLWSVEEPEKQESVVLSEGVLSENDQSVSSFSTSPGKEEFNDEVGFIDGNKLCDFDSEPESIKLWDKFSVMNHMMDPNSDEFLSDGDFDGGSEAESAMELGEKKVELMEDTQSSEEVPLESRRILDQEGFDLSDQTLPVENAKGHQWTDIDEVLEMINDIEKLEELHLQHSSILETDAHIEREFREIRDECEQEDSVRKGVDVVDDHEKQEESHLQDQSLSDFKESNLQEQSLSDFEESNGLETLWEHQDLIEQLKMELRNVRATGLPTILEESESPRMSEDLKPWKIEEKFVLEDRMDELHKFYKSYRERMRKFDILNYQKMYAMGFLQLKDPLQSITNQKSSAPTLTSMLSKNFLLPKRRRPEADSSVMFVRELESHLETVYVGQLCLSWEFLYWQYGKARELLESDPYEIRPYNQVAGEFQQFQVLMQRFLENEPFQGPRVQNYIKNRCVLRNLLQVPVIKEDPKDKEGRRLRKDAITCSMLLGIVEESLHIFWDFVRADKQDGSNVILKGLCGPQVKLLDPADTELLMDVQTNLQKKEKKLKDILRSGNCIVKRFQKHQKEQSDQLVFFSQVDLKLVSRVLKMSRITTDQLVWCHTKLGRISIVQRKIHVEPSFLLFPC